MVDILTHKYQDWNRTLELEAHPVSLAVLQPEVAETIGSVPSEGDSFSGSVAGALQAVVPSAGDLTSDPESPFAFLFEEAARDAQTLELGLSSGYNSFNQPLTEGDGVVFKDPSNFLYPQTQLDWTQVQPDSSSIGGPLDTEPTLDYFTWSAGDGHAEANVPIMSSDLQVDPEDSDGFRSAFQLAGSQFQDWISGYVLCSMQTHCSGPVYDNPTCANRISQHVMAHEGFLPVDLTGLCWTLLNSAGLRFRALLPLYWTKSPAKVQEV
ncbi:hypothetical protein DFP72DRAFT_853933 [Ephemerocybe angulata]|uniref:Uncharacterized protein n=1 Tax=Ephemerocybe angulata TaxID=980116 RepID=A0A8H6HJ28_9AGAR|nr:hypothetical protein DFP72DRAFT_853933 [Tulosesus angulatus]